MLPGAISIKRVEPVAWRIPQIFQCFGPIEHPQPIKRPILDIGRQLAAAKAVPDPLCFLVCERVNHDQFYLSVDNRSLSISTVGPLIF